MNQALSRSLTAWSFPAVTFVLNVLSRGVSKEEEVQHVNDMKGAECLMCKTKLCESRIGYKAHSEYEDCPHDDDSHTEGHRTTLLLARDLLFT